MHFYASFRSYCLWITLKILVGSIYLQEITALKVGINLWCVNTGQHTGKCARFRRVFIPETVLLGGVQCSECARTGGVHKWNGESLTASTTGAQNRSYFCVPLGPRGLKRDPEIHVNFL